jgi:PAS domain S-box-containing protein
VYLFRMRHLLFTLLGLMAAVSLAAVVWSGRLAVKELNETQRLLAANAVSELTLKVNTYAAMERGITTAMLAMPARTSDSMRAEMARLRSDSESYVIAALEAAQALLELNPAPQLRTALDVLHRERQRLLRARGTADTLLQRGERGGETYFLSAATAFVEAAAALRSAALSTATNGNFVRRDNLLLKESLYIASEYAGRERALLGVAIAQQRPLLPAERELLYGIRNTADVALNTLEEALGGLLDDSDIAAAQALMNEEFRRRYHQLRVSVYAASEQRKAYPFDVETWYREATRGIDSLIHLGATVNAAIARAAEQRARRARDAAVVFALAALLVLAILLAAVFLIHRRVTLPLKMLEQAAEGIGRGDYEKPLRLPAGDELGELGAAFDKMRRGLLEQMHERDRAETLLRASAQRFRNLVESTNDLLWETDRQGRYSYVSPQIEALLGYTPEEVLGRTPFDLMPRDEAARLEALFQELLVRRAPIRAVENINRHKNGRLVVLETNGVAVLDEHGEYSGYRGIDRDITERRQAEQAQRESERRFRDLLENMQLMAVMLDDGGNITFINDFLLHRTGWARGEVIGRSWFDLFLPAEARAGLRALYLRTMAGGLPASPHEHEILTRDGSRRRIVWNSIVIRGPDERAAGSASVGADVTEQRKNEAEMQKLLRVVEQTDDAVVIMDPGGIIEYVNAAFERGTGRHRDEVVGTDSRLLFTDQPDPDFYQRMWSTISAGKPFQALMTSRRKNGELLYEERTITPLRDAAGTITHYVSTSKDVTERRRMDEQLQQSEKLASIGQLAAGVAHEINNPVGYISSNIGTLTRYLDDIFRLLDAYERVEVGLAESAAVEELHALKQDMDLAYLRDDIRALIDESGEGVSRVKKIVQDLKDFSRQEEAVWQVVDLHKGLESTLNIVHNELKYKAEVVREYGELPQVECIPSQLNQVFMNLLVNAAHAIEQQGVITVRTGAEQEWVWVEVEDTGKGIAPENLNRLFEPFFTTKPIGKGTGLGLSISYGIVQKHGGRIEVESEPGRGSRFRVWLPVAQPAQAEAEC